MYERANMMTEKMRIFSTVSNYDKLKKLFEQFSLSFTDFLSKQPKFGMSRSSLDEVSFVLKLFDKQVMVSFSLILNSRNVPLGMVTFEVLLNKDDKTKLMAMYFDHLGNVYRSLADTSSFVNFTQGTAFFEELGFELLTSYLRLPFVKVTE